jgi:hypothetical protein
MDLIYMNAAKEDLGVMRDFTLDLAYGADENDFECKIVRGNHCCESGYYLYYEGAEYGGIIDSVGVDTESDVVTYYGRTWHGILNSKILCPDAGADYLTVSGEANAVLAALIARMGLETLFKASEEDSGINIPTFKMDRYIAGYDGIRKMLRASGAKLNIVFNRGFAVLSAKPIVDYSKDEQFDTDQIAFKIKRNDSPVNHVICLGKGDLAEREVVHLYADKNGAISSTQSLTGIQEVAAVYDYSNAESTEELRKGGVELLEKSWNSNEIDFNFDADDKKYDVGDIVGAVEIITGIRVATEISKKIVSIQNYTTTISYKVGEQK